MKYSQLKAIFVSSKVTVSATKTLLSFNTSTKEVQLCWSEDLSGKPFREWVAVFSSTDFPAIVNDGEIKEVIPLKEDGLIKIRVSDSEVFLPCKFIEGTKPSEDLLWSTYSLTEGDIDWFRTHHGASKMHIEVHGGNTMAEVMALATYKDSGLQSVRFLKGKSRITRTTRSGERIAFDPEQIPLKGMKGDLKLYRFSSGIQFSFFSFSNGGGEVISHRTPILEVIPGTTLDHCKILATGDLVNCPPDFGKRLKTLVKEMTEKNKVSFSMKIENGILTIGNDGICLPFPEAEATGSVVFALKKMKKMMELVPLFPKRIGISFPDRLVGVNKEGLKIPEYLVITLIPDEIVDKFDDDLIHCDRILIACEVKVLYKLFGQEVNNMTEINKKRIVEATMRDVEKTAEKSIEILDAIASVIKKKVKKSAVPFGVGDELTPEFIQGKKNEIEAMMKKLAPLKNGGDLRAFKAQKIVLQALDFQGRMLEIIYEIETSALSRGILLDFFGDRFSLAKTEIEVEVEEDINLLGQFVTDVVKAIQDPATEHIKWTLEQIQKTLEALEAGLKVSSKAVGDTTQEITNILNGITKKSDQFVKQLLQQIINYWNEYWKERILECILSMGLAEKALTIVSKIKKNYPKFSSSQIAQNVINEKLLYSLITGMVGAIPGATFLVDLSVTTPLLIQMVYEIACAYKQDIKSPESTQEILAILALTLTVDNLPKMGLGFLLKHTPIASWAINPIINATLFLGVGYAACQYYEVKLSGKDPLSAETYQELIAKVNSYFDQLITEGKKVQEIVNKAISLKDKLPAAT
ncbi:hypothetical protein [Planktothrix agardhii]|jgi:uncharacterized protein (DUF697 family)|uniref:hypothetical protein n=1 Tax=Planktothrix agardhii TaxID=1160 RepID=UPI003783647E